MENENPITKNQEAPKKKGGAKRFFKAVFVHNFWGKFTAVIISAALWVLAVGLA